MPRRYHSRPTGWEPSGEWEVFALRGSTSVDVFERDSGPVPTGLLDKNGNELFAQDVPNPIGFTAKVED